MICVSIAETDVEKCIEALAGLEMAEIRLDMVKLGVGNARSTAIKKIFSQPLKLIATCRPGSCSEEDREKIIIEAIGAGASFVDVEVEGKDEYKKKIVQKARASGCKVIISFHDYKKTPSAAELSQIVDWCFQSGADIAKIACIVHTDKENARLLSLLDNERKMIVIGMGMKGRITRIVAPMLGSVFTFASREKGKETAEGQMTKDELEQRIRYLGDRDD